MNVPASGSAGKPRARALSLSLPPFPGTGSGERFLPGSTQGAALAAASMVVEDVGGAGEGASQLTRSEEVALARQPIRGLEAWLLGTGLGEAAQAMGEVEFSARAYAKMRLHAAAHPPAAVTGLLLGRRAGPPACLCLADCVPLFHGSLALSAMLDAALHQVDAWAASSNLLLAGCYQAKAGLDDMSPSPLVLKMAGHLAELVEDAVLIMLDNRNLTMDPRVPPIIVLEQWDQHWLPKDKNLVMWRDWESSRHICKSLLEAKAYTRLVDFDAHLDDIRQDWTNQQLNAEIAQLAAVANGST